MAKLTYADATRMRALHKEGASISRLREIFKVGESAIFAVLRGATYSEPQKQNVASATDTKGA